MADEQAGAVIAGILFGFIAAFFASCSYLFSRRYVAKFTQGALSLLVAGHVIMGVFSLALLPFLAPKTMPSFLLYALPLAGCVVFYLAGQASLFLCLQDADASRVSPLLGLKILMLSALAVIFTNQHFHALQWAGIVIAICAAGILGMLGREMTAKSWMWVLFACFFYSLSDLSIKVLIGRFGQCGLFHASVFSACLCYLCSGLAACAALPFCGRVSLQKWKASFPFAGFWYAGIVFLFLCFGAIGVVFGNIVQSTRGVMSILMGSYVSSKGYEHIEEKVSPRVIFLRLFAGILMILAIVLFYTGQ
jgi:drug/metabolite transporter (DMT)-like permease